MKEKIKISVIFEIPVEKSTIEMIVYSVGGAMLGMFVSALLAHHGLETPNPFTGVGLILVFVVCGKNVWRSIRISSSLFAGIVAGMQFAQLLG